MSSAETGRFVARGTLVALCAGTALAVAGLALGASLGWLVCGWALPSLLALAGGAWLVRLHGTPGGAFLVALGIGLLARLLVLTGGAVAAGLAGGGALGSYGLGLAVAFVTMLSYEATWFVAADRRRACGGEATDG